MYKLTTYKFKITLPTGFTIGEVKASSLANAWCEVGKEVNRKSNSEPYWTVSKIEFECQ